MQKLRCIMANVLGGCNFSFSSSPLCLLQFLRESHDLNPKPSLGGAVIKGSRAKGKQTFPVIQRKFECWHTASFLSLRACHGFSCSGLLQRKNFVQICQGGSWKTWSFGGVGSGLSSMCWSRSAQHCEEGALQCQWLLDLLNERW